MPSLAYEPTRFASLAPIHVAALRLPDFKTLLPALGSTIRTYGLEQFVGVTLLHKHFDLGESERVLRSYYDREARIHPTAARESLVSCVWSVEVGGALVPLEFVDTDNLLVARAEADMLVASQDFLDAFTEILERHDASDVFGLATLHGWRALNPGIGETIVETTLTGDRQLGLKVETEAHAASLSLVETLWIFSANDKGGIDCSVPQHCGIHCLGHPLD